MTETGIFQKVESDLPWGTKLDPNYLVTGVRSSRGELGLFYSIPNNRGGKRSQKSIVQSELEKAYECLMEQGEFTKAWFRANMPLTASQSTSCSFKVVGEVFSFFGLAKGTKTQRGHKYVRI